MHSSINTYCGDDMKVLILTIWYPNDENPVYGTFVHEQADALRAHGIDIRVVQPLPLAPFPVTLFKSSYRKLARIADEEVYQRFTVYHPRYLTLPRHLLFERVGDWMYHAIRQCMNRIYSEWPFDIVHAHTTYPCGYAANRLRDRDFPAVKVIHTVHATCIVDAPTYNRRCFERVRSSLEGADRNVFVSLKGQSLGLEYTGGSIKDKSEYITNGVSPEKFQLTEADRAELKSLKTKYGNTWNLVYVGYVSERKGIKELLSAVQRLAASGRRKLRLILVGRNDLGSFIRDFTRAEGLEDIVVQVGPVLHDRVKIWMALADAFILPSHSEGMPTVLFESLYAGTPAIFTRVGGIGDIVEDGREALLIPPKSVDAIEQSIVRLMDDPDLCREMGARGHKLIRDNFTWAINADRHLRLYEQVLADR
jgi:teichuronic acid biosynthesis glycosyltransferase TuaC